jgi:hypothetical protein
VAQAVRQPLNAEAQVCPGSVRVGFIVDKVTLRRVSLQVLWFPSVNYHSTMAVHTYMKDPGEEHKLRFAYFLREHF